MAAFGNLSGSQAVHVGVGNPGRRTVQPAGYAAYIRSPEWAAVRRRYWASKLPKVCYCCGVGGQPLDLHHRTYKNLGQERLMDLLPLCRRCHGAVHDLVDEIGWAKLWGAAKIVRRPYRAQARRAKSSESARRHREH